MSFQAMTIALAIDLPSTQKSLLLCLANYVNEQNKFWPSYNTLAKDSGMCRRTVITHMNDFVQKGIVDKQNQICNKGHKSNLYTFKGVQYLKKLGYTSSLTDTGYIQITKPQPSNVEGCKPITTPSANGSPPSANGSPNTIKEPIRETIIKDIVENEFDILYSVWPNSKNKKKSLSAFRTVCSKSKAEPKFIRESLVQDIKLRIANKQFAFEQTMLSSYLNGERWKDGHDTTAIRKDPLLEAMGLT